LPGIDGLVFIGGGVIVPRLSELALDALFPDRGAAAEVRLEAAALERKLACGMLAPDAYCRRLLAVSGSDRRAPDLADAICEKVAPRSNVPSLLADLAARVDLQLVCDYPRAWWEPAAARHELDQFFSGEAIFYAAEQGLPPDYRAYFEALVSAGVIRRGRSLWVDHHSPRTSAAIRGGVHAAIFVDAERFRRDLGLWGLLPPAS
jgi:hypothetical protein